MAIARFTRRLFEPIDNGSLVVFRICFGLLMFAESAGAIATGWVTRTFVEPQYNFPIVGFQWLSPPPGETIYAYYLLMAAAGLAIAFGFAFRFAVAVFTVMWTGVYLMQTTHYNNHYYLIILLNLLLMTTPANADVSIDARRDPSIRSRTCPRWCVTIFILQTAVVYGYATFAKLQPDWLAAKPLGIWLATRENWAVVGPFYAQPWLKYALSWAGIAFDGLIVPALLWSRTRRYALATAVFFHLFNSFTFRIGVFPYMALALCVFFFPPDRMAQLFLRRGSSDEQENSATRTSPYPRSAVWQTAFAVYFALQLAMPLRHLAYPGNVNWTEDGYRMSWRMMLRSKTGTALFVVSDPDGSREWKIRPASRLSRAQVTKIAHRPDMIWLFSRYLAGEFEELGHPNVRVLVQSNVRLNGRPPHPFVDPGVDMARAPWRLYGRTPWVTDAPD
jgi:uncharacterized membrane protein YphA (DoxX/SURF4 family)